MENETIFVEVFGSNPVIKVLDFLIGFQLFDYPLTEIARNSGVSYSTLQTVWNRLEKNGIVIKTRRVGKSDLFKLNTNNPAVKQLVKLDWNLVGGLVEKEEGLLESGVVNNFQRKVMTIADKDSEEYGDLKK
jgi:DNA-binding transcriptional ArsR family regulator